jgi:hypothetical protein
MPVQAGICLINRNLRYKITLYKASDYERAKVLLFNGNSPKYPFYLLKPFSYKFVHQCLMGVPSFAKAMESLTQNKAANYNPNTHHYSLLTEITIFASSTSYYEPRPHSEAKTYPIE